jgi:peptidoglycan/LPS O-acetylase OafA/YrhL
MRNRYLDVLRAVATVRVIVYHSSGWAALTIAFPAMSVMFALAGSMIAASLDRYGPFAVERRLRRLLPSLWLVAAIAIPAMVLAGHAWDWNFLLWGFPLEDPPATGFWMEALSATWYLRDFLWLVLLSPLLLPLFRRFPIVTLLAPYVALLIITLANAHLHPVAHDLALYGGSWILGFAHHDKMLRGRLQLYLAGALAIAAGWWVLGHPGPRGYDLNDIPLGNALWSAAFVLIVLRYSPAIRGNRLITILNARALTIYLWHVPAIVAVSYLAIDMGWPIFGPVGIGWRMPVVFALVAVAVLLTGWVEDLAAGRPIQLIPGKPADRPVPDKKDGELIVVQPGKDERHERFVVPDDPADLLRPRVREHAGGVPDLGREHDLPVEREVDVRG